VLDYKFCNLYTYITQNVVFFYQIIIRPTEVWNYYTTLFYLHGKWSLCTSLAEEVAWTPCLVRDRTGYVQRIVEHIHLNPQTLAMQNFRISFIRSLREMRKKRILYGSQSLYVSPSSCPCRHALNLKPLSRFRRNLVAMGSNLNAVIWI